jgi:hypothetical protein
MKQFKQTFHYHFPLVILALLLLSACAGRPDAEVPAPTSTPELAVVVFATPEPTATQPPAPPTKAATVGVVIQPATPTVSENQVSAGEVSPINRPPDVNPLTGLKVDDPALLQRLPLMVRVGNDPGARPQVGLNEADMVYEEVVEWWVTRFTAIYLSKDPEMIAPIRSARLINLQLGPQYRGALLNSGGSDQVRWELSQAEFVNLDEYFVSSPYFYRENEGWQTRLAVDATLAREYLANQQLETDPKLRGFVFNPKLELKDIPQDWMGSAQEVIVPYPRQTSEARWVYDSASGRYLRFTAGEPMLDFKGEQISAANVIIYFAEHQDTDIVEDSNGATSIRIIVEGLGSAWLMRDGQYLKGNWQTDGRETPLFIFNNSQPIPFKPGNTWVEVVPLEYEITIDGTSHARLAAASTQDGAGEAAPEPSPTLTPIGFRATPTPNP